MDIQQFRELNPNFKSIGDKELSQKLYSTYYADKMDFDAFDRKFRPLAYKYDALDKAKYMGRAGAEGLTFGLGDIVGGVTNTVMAPIGKTVNHFVEGTPLTASDFNPWQNFKEGRREFVEEQEDFKEAHPWLNAGGELVGAAITGLAGAGKKLATTAGKQGLKALVNEGAREGAKFGMAYGAGSGLTQDVDKLSVPNALIGAGVGGLGGAVFGGALAPASKIASSILTRTPLTTQEAKNAALRRLVEQNPELVQKSISEGTPLINIADKKLFRTTRGAVSSDAEAEQILFDYARKFNADKFDKVEGLINQQLGETSSFGAVQNILEEGRRTYKPIYDEVMKAGDLQIPITNQRVLNAIETVAKEYPELNKLPETDIRVLDLAKQELDDQIGAAVRRGENYRAMRLEKAKNELVAQMDAKVPQYVEARKAFKAMKDLEDLVAQGKSVKQLTRDELATLYAKTAPEERGAIKAGIRDVMVGDLDRINSEGANAIKKVFSPSMLRKLERIGLADDKIAQAIAAEDLANANIQGVFGGANTAQKIADILNNNQEGVSVGRAIFQPMRTAKRYGIKSVDYLVNKMQNSSPAETARLMTDPQYLKSEYDRVFGKVAKVLNKADKPANTANGSIGQIIKGKLKEEGGFAWKDLPKDKYTSDPNVYDNFIGVHKEAGKIEKSPADWGGKTIEDARKTFGFKANGRAEIKTPIETVNVTEGNLEHLFEENEPQRVLSINKALQTMKKPNLVVNADKNGKNYNYYVKLFSSGEKTKNHLQVVKVAKDGSFYTTNYPSNKKRIADIIKEGRIVYDASNSRNMRAK